MQSTPFAIDGFSLPLVQPESVEHLVQLVREARLADQALYPVGGRTMLGLGLTPSQPGSAIDLTRIAQVVDYPARDMTITVRAGITVSELRQLLARENQRLPVDVPRAESATLGGILATNTSGLRRYGFGTLRDYVIGISFINDKAEEVKAGGRVVKNVAGYDLCKLCIGALGTLGILTQVTLKVVPRPEQNALLTLGCDENKIDDLLNRLHQTNTRPVAIELLNAAAVQRINNQARLNLSKERWLVIVGFESNNDAVNWQVQQLIREIKTDYSLEARIGPTAANLWRALEELPGGEEAGLSFKATMPSSRCGEFCRRLVAMGDGILVQAHAGNGIVIGHLAQDSTLDQATDIIARSRQWLADAGSLIVTNCPPEWKRAIAVWGPPPASAKLMRAIKEQLDPKRIFNPGRFVDGI